MDDRVFSLSLFVAATGETSFLIMILGRVSVAAGKTSRQQQQLNQNRSPVCSYNPARQVRRSVPFRFAALCFAGQRGHSTASIE